MAQSIKCPLCKQEDRSLAPQHPCKQLGSRLLSPELERSRQIPGVSGLLAKMNGLKRDSNFLHSKN